ncbi:MAG: hypothetical protein ACRDL5_15905 [Solirubrobacteraceae bacterium]
MSRYQDEPVLVAAFAPARALEPTDSEVAAVLERVAVRHGGAGPSWLARVRVGGLFAAFGVAIAVAVAAAGIVLVGHARPSRAPAAGAVVPAAARGLVSQLAVLRRPQTAADRAVPWSTDQVQRRSFDRLVPGLTRRVFTFPNGRGLFMVILAHPTSYGAPGSLLPSRLGDGVALWSLCCNGVDEQASWLSADTQLVPEERGVPQASAMYYAYSVVSDRVARVKWTFAGVRTPTRTWPRATIWAKVQNNVAVARVMPFPLRVLSATWYGTDGHVIASRTWTLKRRSCQQQPSRCAHYL